MAPSVAESLTPPVILSTDLPFPARPPLPADLSIGTAVSNTYNAAYGAELGQTITVETCSELTQHRFPLDVFSARDNNDGRDERLAVLTDKRNQPMVFSVGSDHVRRLDLLSRTF